MSDPAKYRTREEVDKVRTTTDPIDMAKHRIVEKKWASEEQLKKIESEVRERVNAASEFATNDPEPNTSELFTDIYR
jgi:pyruvate dehydrogenase E1 component alpha subunit